MFAIVKENRVKQPLYRSNGVVRGWRLKTRAEWLRATSCGADRIPQETQWQASPHRLSGFLRHLRAALREWRRRKNGRASSLGSMNECSAISDLPASTPSMKSTSHFGGNDGHEPSFSGKDDACRRGALERGVAPQVAGGCRRAPPTAPTAPAQSGARTAP